MNEILLINKQEKIEGILLELKDDLHNKDITEKNLKDLAEKFADSAVFLVLQKDKKQVLGFIAFYCNDYVNYKAFISMIAVKNQYHHKGWGTKLLEEAIKISQNEGMKTLSLEVAKENRKAQDFYRKQGFLLVKEEKNSCFMRTNI